MKTSDDLAENLVAHFNAATLALKCPAEKPPVVPDFEKETATSFRIYLVPYSESEEAFDQGDTCREELHVSVVVHGPLSATVSRARALELVKSARLSLRETEFDGFRWFRNETLTLLDREALRTKNTLLSSFRALYYNFE